MHVPDVSIPDAERSDTESRAVAWRMKVGSKRVVVDVVTGAFTLHKALAAQVPRVTGTRFELPNALPFESAVLLALLVDEGRVSVFATVHGARAGARLGYADAYAVLHAAAAGLASAVRRGYVLDRLEPPGEPYDLDRLPEPNHEGFDVGPKMLADFEVDVRNGLVILHEEIALDPEQARAAEVAAAPRPPAGEPRRVSFLDFLKSRAARADTFSDDE